MDRGWLIVGLLGVACVASRPDWDDHDHRMIYAAAVARRMGTESFDEPPLVELDLEAIDFAAASQSFSEIRTLRRNDLISLGMVRTHQGRQVPTIGGFLLFGLGRLERFPDARIQAGLFAGTDTADILDQAETMSDRSTHPVEALPC